MSEPPPSTLHSMDLLRNLTLAVLLGAVGSLLAAPTAAQQPQELDLLGSDDRVDRVVAVVGDSVIVESEIQERMLQLQAQGTDLPDDPEARDSLRRDLLETMVNEKLIVQAAVQDTTVSVNESRVDEIVQQDLQQRIQAFGSEGAMRQALRSQGMTLSAFREMLRSDARQQQLQNQYLGRQQRSAASITVTEEEMRAFFEDNRDRLGDRPATVTFEQIVMRPRAADSASASARARAEALLDSLRAGADFQELARRHSDDPGTREDGGDLGWFRRGQMVPAFEDAVFSLREGQISDIVETRFGYHIIKVDRTRGSERRASHILITPNMTDADVDAVRARAQDLKDRLAAGASVDSLQAEFDNAEQPDSMTVPLDRLQQLPPGYEEALQDARPGDVLGPLEWGPADQVNVAVLKVTDVRQGGAFDYEEVKPQIQQRLQQQKMMERIFADLREETHIEIRM